MWSLVGALTMVGLVVVGLAVLVGKLPVEDALLRIGALVVILALAPCVAALTQATLPLLLKPVLLLLLMIVVVAVFVRVVVSLF